jgi:hypothetical protein
LLPQLGRASKLARKQSASKFAHSKGEIPDAGGCAGGCSVKGERTCSADGLTVLECINRGTAYAATNSGGPCSDGVSRCQCWEDDGTRPWEVLDYVARLTCDQAGRRMEVFFPSGGNYCSGVHPVPGDYDPRATARSATAA